MNERQMESKNSEDRSKCIITAQGSSTFIYHYFINGSMYYIHQVKSYGEK